LAADASEFTESFRSVADAGVDAVTEISGYEQGTACWVDLWTPNRETSMDFYVGVAEMVTPPDGPDASTVWVTYLAVHDLDAALATPYFAVADTDSSADAVRAGGGCVLSEPMDTRSTGWPPAPIRTARHST
jgi:hypothetical protein